MRLLLLSILSLFFVACSGIQYKYNNTTSSYILDSNGNKIPCSVNTKIKTSRSDKLLIGGDSDKLLIGGDSDKLLIGGDSDKLLIGGDSDKLLIGGDSDKLLIGGDTDKLLIGGGSSDYGKKIICR